MAKPLYKWRFFLGLLALACFAMAIFNSVQVARGQNPTDYAVKAVIQFLGIIALIVYYRQRNEAPLTLDISKNQGTSTNTKQRANREWQIPRP
jgi:hypothetical protein